MNIMLRPVLATFTLSLMTACGGGDAGSEPVDITLGNLDGYWLVTSAETWGARPGLVHFGIDAYPGEAPEGATHIAEVVGFGGGNSVVTYALSGSTLQLDGVGTLTIDSLTRDEMVVQFGGMPVTLTRRSDCAGPGFWMDGGARIFDAAWDPSGGLHVMSSTSARSGYGWVAPGRCTVTLPETPLVAATIDIADNGDIRLLQFTRSGALPGEITVTTVPAKPWARETLDQTRKIIPAPSTPASDPPPLKSIEIGGKLTVFYAYAGQLFAATEDGETELELQNGSTFTPGHLTIAHLPDKSWIIRAANYREGLRYVDGRYERWTAEVIDATGGVADHALFASVFAYDGDTLYAAWTESVEGGYPTLIVGKKVGAAWQRVTAGQGFPMALRVAGGVIDVIGSLDEEALGPMVWTRLPRFAENVWRQEYALGFDGTIDAVLPRNAAAGGLFGPRGEVFMAVEGAVWRRANLEKEGEYYRWNQVDVTFETETDAAVAFPTLGERCAASEPECSFKVPTSAIFPAVVEVPGESAESNLVGGRATPTKDSYAVVANTSLIVDYGPIALRLETSIRRMTPVVLGPDEVQSLSGAAVAYPGGFAVTRTAGGVTLSKIEGGELVDEVLLDGFEPKRLHARSGGGFALPLSQPTLTKGGVGLLSADLELVGEVPFPDGIRGYALTDDGFIGFSYEGPDLVLAEYTEAGATTPVASPVRETTELAALGDGIVAFEPIDNGVAPTFAGDPSRSVWRKLGVDGGVDWTLTSQRSAKLVWKVVAGDLYVASEIGATFEIGGATYQGVSPDGTAMYLVARFDGATGTIKSHRVTALPWLNGVAQPTSISGDADGVLLAESFAADLMIAYVPFSAASAVVVQDYLADVIGGYCLQPGTQCSANDTAFAPLGNGRFGGVWTQIFSTNYDGQTITSAARKAVAGEYNPTP